MTSAAITASDTVTKFLLKTTRLCPKPGYYALKALHYCTGVISSGVTDPFIEVCAASTGSNSEFYIEPMLSCVGDRDIMYFDVSLLAIPEGYPVPIKLPPEFHTFTNVYKIVDSDFKPYVYLMLSHVLVEDDDEGAFKAVECNFSPYLQNDFVNADHDPNSKLFRHGPAMACEADTVLKQGVIAKNLAVDFVFCIRCLSWPPQAANWPERGKIYGWPDSVTVDRVVNNGCDVVPIAHPLCKQDERMGKYQWRLSFSRAETVLLNSWMPVQQIAYHMLRVFIKTERLTDSNVSTGNKLSNYHIKTLILWSSELKPSTWWTDGPNLVRVCVELLHDLSTQLTDAHSQHYFVDGCNLLPDERSSDELAVVAALLASSTESSLAQWFVDNYIKRCCRELDTCKAVAPMFNNITSCAELDAAVSALIACKLENLCLESYGSFTADQFIITRFISRWLFNIRSIISFISQQQVIDERLFLYAAASVFLHAAVEIEKSGIGGDFDKYVEVLAAVVQCFSQSSPPTVTNSRRRLLGRNLLRRTAALLRTVTNESINAMKLLEIELAKAYLTKTLSSKDSNSDSIYCLANVYIAVLYYASGQYRSAMDHCSAVIRLQDHSCCNSHVVQGELLPKIDDDVDCALGLAVFYQYIRQVLLNQHQMMVSFFTTEQFADYLHMKSHSALNMTVGILPDDRCSIKRCLATGSTLSLLISDVLLLKTVVQEMKQSRSVGLNSGENFVGEKSEFEPQPQQDTSKLVGLLRRCAVEHLTSFRRRLRQDFGPSLIPVTNDFDVLYAFHRGQYRLCIRLCKDIVDRLHGLKARTVLLLMYPEFMQLMDDDIVSLFGLMLLLKPTIRDSDDHVFSKVVCVSQRALALYLLAQSQIKLNCFPLALFDTNLCTQLTQAITAHRHPDLIWERLVLKLTARRIAIYRQTCMLRMLRGEDEYDRQSFDELVQDVKAVTARNKPA